MPNNKLKLQLTRAFLLSMLCVLGFVVMAVLVVGEKVHKFDRYWIDMIQGLETPALTAAMKFFTFAGSTASVVVLSIVVLFFLLRVVRHRGEAVLFLAVVAGAGLLNQVLKVGFHRLRPEFHRLIEVGGYSFPSGHSMSAFAFYGILAFLLWRHIPTRWGRGLMILAGIAMIVAIGVSRVYLGVHYPSDVVAGYLAGGFWLAASVWVYQRRQERASVSPAS